MSNMTKISSKIKPLVVDLHSHLYSTTYLEILKARSKVPYVTIDESTGNPLLFNSGPVGKPLTPVFYDIRTKIEFMDQHNIDISVLSLGNPWLDFLPIDTAAEVAQSVNDSFQDLCTSYPGRLFFFAALPLSASVDVILAEVVRVRALPHVRGVVFGPNGLGNGLDDDALLPVFRALAEANLPVFLHPCYGLPHSLYGPCNHQYGNIMTTALGFPMETTIAVARMILKGVFVSVPDLQFIVSHSGGTLPFLAGRIESCIDHDRSWKVEGKSHPCRQTVWDVCRKNLYLDSVIFDKVGLKAAIEASGVDRVMFGTDHPFFMTLGDVKEKWPTFTTNEKAARDTLGGDDEYNLVMGGNAVRVLSLR